MRQRRACLVEIAPTVGQGSCKLVAADIQLAQLQHTHILGNEWLLMQPSAASNLLQSKGINLGSPPCNCDASTLLTDLNA